MSGTLHVVATPIGNLEDITLRALRVLREVAAIAAEDTRHTAKLLHHHGIQTPTISFHEHNARARTSQLIRRLSAGESIALVTDAGTPGVSDPGSELVRACHDAGIAVNPVPGASALLAALAASGFPAEPLTFVGFPPTRAKSRNIWLQRLSATKHTVVLFEAPHRIKRLLHELTPLLGNRPLLWARELTKIHQEFRLGTADILAKTLNSPRGEYTLVLGPVAKHQDSQAVTPDGPTVIHEFRHLTDTGGMTRRAAITELARKYRQPARQIYAWVEQGKAGLP